MDIVSPGPGTYQLPSDFAVTNMKESRGFGKATGTKSAAPAVRPKVQGLDKKGDAGKSDKPKTNAEPTRPVVAEKPDVLKKESK